MGIFKTILGGLGFKQEDEQENQYVQEYESENVKPINEQPKQEETSNNINVNNLICYEPKTTNDLKQIVVYLKNNKPCIVNLSKLNADETKRVLDYLSGAMFALSATISRLQGSLYVLSPNGINITTV